MRISQNRTLTPYELHSGGFAGKAETMRMRVPVMPGDTADTLAARVLTQEHVVYPRAVAHLIQKL